MTAPSFVQAFAVVKAIDADFTKQCRLVEDAYEEEMRPVRAEYHRRERDAARRLKTSLEELKRWRNTAVRVAGAMPVKASLILTATATTCDAEKRS